MGSVLQKWVMKRCSLREQGTLVTGLRGPDGFANHPIKPWVRFVRVAILVSADSTGKAKFMAIGDLPSIHAIHTERPIDELPVHFFAHLMHALQVIGVRHPNSDTALGARCAYRGLVKILHLNEERDEDMIERLRTR